MIDRLWHNALIGMEALAFNRTRALLTSLGIIFGVASVIAMLAIGRGAEQAILDQINLLGTNNLIIVPVVKQEEGPVDDVAEGESADESRGAEKIPFSPGLTLADAISIRSHVPMVSEVSPEVVIETMALREGLRRSMKLVGVSDAYFRDGAFATSDGRLFSPAELNGAVPVAIIGSDVRTKFFPKENPVGKRIKCGDLWLTVVGVMRERSITAQEVQRLGIRNYDMDIYAPIRTVLTRYEDRNRLTRQDIMRSRQEREKQERPNYHQLDRLIVRLDDSRAMGSVADLINRMLERRHNGVIDYEVIIPEQLLSQERDTQNIFNIVLASIAFISLLVGGIGIMNIMLASVMERTREIGVRRAVGATGSDIQMQFLAEATAISLVGGLSGIAIGVLLSTAIEKSSGIETMVSIPSVVLAFVVSVGVGLVFGFMPARSAARYDPIVSLRHE